MGAIGTNTTGTNTTKYTVYRAGDLSGGPTGMVFYTTAKSVAEEYAKPSSFRMQGKTYKREARTVNKYDVSVKNPLVITNYGSDSSAALEAYRQLHSGRKVANVYDIKSLAKYAKEDGYAGKITSHNARDIYVDWANAKALRSSKYDAIIYNYVAGLAPGSKQILMPAKRRKR